MFRCPCYHMNSSIIEVAKLIKIVWNQASCGQQIFPVARMFQIGCSFTSNGQFIMSNSTIHKAAGRQQEHPQRPFPYSRLQCFSGIVPGKARTGSASGFMNSTVKWRHSPLGEIWDWWQLASAICHSDFPFPSDTPIYHWNNFCLCPIHPHSLTVL